jgi:hypothetical protein
VPSHDQFLNIHHSKSLLIGFPSEFRSFWPRSGISLLRARAPSIVILLHSSCKISFSSSNALHSSACRAAGEARRLRRDVQQAGPCRARPRPVPPPRSLQTVPALPPLCLRIAGLYLVILKYIKRFLFLSI